MEYWQLQIYDDQSSEYVYQSDPFKTHEGLAEDIYKNLDDLGVRIEAYHCNVYESGFVEYQGDVTDAPEKYEHKGMDRLFPEIRENQAMWSWI
jgi:hypothetical protein